VRARAQVQAARQDGRDRLVVLRSDPPLTLRDTPQGLHLVGSGAGPLGGDDLHLDVRVGAGAELVVRSAAASLVQPGPSGAPSQLVVDVEVGEGGSLRWLAEPAVLVRGCDHRATVRVRLAEGASLLWRDELVLGRHGEGSGSVLQRLSVDVAGQPRLRNDLAVGPRWPGSQGPAGVDDAGAVGTLVVVGRSEAAVGRAVAAWVPEPRARLAWLALGGGGGLVSAVASSPGVLARTLDAVLDHPTPEGTRP
jgi:urease accessory protein